MYGYLVTLLLFWKCRKIIFQFFIFLPLLLQFPWCLNFLSVSLSWFLHEHAVTSIVASADDVLVLTWTKTCWLNGWQKTLWYHVFRGGIIGRSLCFTAVLVDVFMECFLQEITARNFHNTWTYWQHTINTWHFWFISIGFVVYHYLLTTSSFPY